MDQRPEVAQPVASIADEQPAHLTIGDLADRTGLSTSVLRMWETRHGFPVPRRLASGHRRYTDADVDLVQRVLRRRASGIRLEAAIVETASTRPPTTPSIFADLRRRHPGLAVHRLKKSTLIAVSRAIEDECCATADRPILFGAFQRRDFYAPSAPRWIELARVARSAIVFAHDWDGSADDAHGPLRATLADDAPMHREWAVVCDALDTTACLTAWELPGQIDVPDRERVFEAIWTVDPAAVRDASRVAAQVALDAGVVAARPLVEELVEPPAAGEASIAAVTALFNRIVAYVDLLG